MELVRQSHPAIFVELPDGFVGDLPHMSIRIGDVAVVAAPESLASLLENAPSGGFGARHHDIDVAAACQILGNGDAAVAGPKLRRLRVVWASRLHTASTTGPAWKKLTLASLTVLDLTNPSRSWKDVALET